MRTRHCTCGTQLERVGLFGWVHTTDGTRRCGSIVIPARAA